MTDEMSALVYSFCGDEIISRVLPRSIALPPCMTMTESQRLPTTARSCETKIIDIPVSRRSSDKSESICACEDTSSALVISSHSSTRGEEATARAIAKRWH